MMQKGSVNAIEPCQGPKEDRITTTQQLSVMGTNEMNAKKESLSVPSQPTVTDAVSETDSNSFEEGSERNSQSAHEDRSKSENDTNAFTGGESPSSSDYESNEHLNDRSSPREHVVTTGNAPLVNEASRENLPLTSKGGVSNTTSIEATTMKEEKSKYESQYHDYSRTPNDKSAELGNALAAVASGKEPPFPVKLHRILSKAEHNDVISWLPHGRSWRVLKPKAFEEKVIPMYFRHAKYASFMRQVNGWGFKRMTQGPDHNSYYHELFLRGLPHLCVKMRRPARAKSGVTDSETNPDFYQISMVHPLPSSTNLGTNNLSALNMGGIGTLTNLTGMQQRAISLQNQGAAPSVVANLGNINLPVGKLGINGLGIAGDVVNTTSLLLQQQLQGQLPQQYFDAGQQMSLQQAVANTNSGNQLENMRRRDFLLRQLQGIPVPENHSEDSNNLAAANMMQTGTNTNGTLLSSLGGLGNNSLNQFQLQQMLSNYSSTNQSTTKLNQNQLIQNAAALGLMGFGAGQLATGHNNAAINNLNTQLLMSQHSHGMMNAGQMGIFPGSMQQGMNNLGNLGGIMMQNQLVQQQQFQAHQLAQAQIQQRNQLQHQLQQQMVSNHDKAGTKTNSETSNTSSDKANEVESRI